MPNVSGLVLFSPNRTITSTTTLTPVSSVAVTLYNIVTKIGASVLTDSTGSFEFTSVPNGSYNLVETYGTTNPGQTPLNFSTATTIPVPIPKDPPVSAISTPLPSGTNVIDSMTPNTFNLIVNSTDLLNQHFVDAPVIYTPVTVLNQISVGANLITLANNGNFGNNFPDTPVNTTPPTNIYPGLATGFTYQPYSSNTPTPGNISIVNIQTLNSFGNWWNITDHTTGSEQGNFLVVNENNPGASIFSQQVSVQPSTYYAFSAWVLNQLNSTTTTNSQFSFNVSGISGSTSNIIYSTNSNIIQASTIVPNWVQIGAIFNSQNYSNISVNLLTGNNATLSNSYAVDDVSLKQVIIDSNIVQTSKSVSNLTNPKSLTANVSDVLLYTIPITNTSSSYNLVNVNVTDTISSGLSFIQGSLVGGTITNTTITNPLVISTDTILAGTTTTVSFKASVNSGITIPTIYNSANVNYGIVIGGNLGPVPGNIFTNTVSTPVSNAFLNINKSVLPTTASNGDTITYTVNLNNSGTVTTNNILFTDTIPLGLSFQPGSFYINNINVPTLSVINNAISTTLPNISSANSSNITFSALVNTISQATIINTATVSYNYISGNTVSQTSTISDFAVLNVASIPVGSVSITKGSFANTLRICDINTYTITISNTTSNDLINVMFYDNLPTEMNYIKNSLTINSVNKNILCLKNGVYVGTIPSNSISTISFNTELVYVGHNCVVNNSACISYNTLQSALSTTVCSNINSITIINNNHSAYLDCSKSVTPNTISNNGVVSYVIDLYNDGRICANNILVTDIIPPQLTYIPNSLYVNCQNMNVSSILNNTLNVTLPCIYPDYYSTIEFNAIVNTISNYTIINTATISYNYIYNCQLSNTITTTASAILNVSTISNSNVLLTKSALFDFIKFNGINTYTVTISNNSSQTLNDVVFYDKLPVEMSYIPNTFTVDGGNCRLSCINYGVIIGDIYSNTDVVVKFKARVTSLGTNMNLENVASISYTTSTSNSNTVSSNICSTTLVNFNC